ncbi:hypothetical protein V9T40_014395 [Parthenolecanium corni]|uniref:TGF-beta family profile domain-containing protein n=1 Tax=Parthenolecanium corni TaxID=536013 RepID=A0AAN9T354_9HEMI
MKCIVLLMLVANLQQLFATYSGLYMDNGRDQTMIERRMTRREKQKFERELLHLLGLPKKPKRTLRSSTLTSSAPKFLLEVYKSLDGGKLKNDFNLKSEDYRSVKESDAIMTFLTKKNYLNSLRHEKGKHLWFDVSDVPVGDTVVGSELRIYKFRNPESEKYTVTVNQVLLDFDGEKELDYVDSVNITNTYEGWLVFNVTSAFMSWVAFPSMNRGLHVSVHKHSKTSHEIHHDAAGIISSNFEENENHQPFLVAFFKYGANNSKLKPRRIRDVNKKKEKSDAEVSYNVNPLTSESAWSYRNCQIQTLYVNFKDLNWQDWIIAPHGYAAYFCSGLCDFPLNAHMNATNHAIVQTLVNLINPSEAPKPCCAPTKLGSIAVLFYLEDNNVILKKYKNMIVKSCGCH